MNLNKKSNELFGRNAFKNQFHQKCWQRILGLADDATTYKELLKTIAHLEATKAIEVTTGASLIPNRLS